MKAERKTITVTEKKVIEVPTTSQRVHMDVSIEEARLICDLLGWTTKGLFETYGVLHPMETWEPLRSALGASRPHRELTIEVRTGRRY